MLEKHFLRKEDQLIANTMTELYGRRMCYNFMNFSNNNMPKSNTAMISKTSIKMSTKDTRNPYPENFNTFSI